MSIDFAALTQAVVAGVPEVRSCLVVSRDGLALGAFPAAEEAKALDVWSRVAALGEVERGFVAVRDEVWVVCRRGPYASVAITSSTARPGLVLDQLERMLLAAEESRSRREGLRVEPEREVQTLDVPRGIRTPLHREPGPAPESPAGSEQAPSEPAAPPAAEDRPRGGGEDEEVDRIALAREFSGLLWNPQSDDEAE